MSWDNIFLLANYWAFAGWIALAFLPRGPKILAAILYAGVFLLCLAYTVLIVGFLTGGIAPGAARGAVFTTLKGVMKLFDSPAAATMGWLHYLAFALFTGMCLSRAADPKPFTRPDKFPLGRAQCRERVGR